MSKVNTLAQASWKILNNENVNDMTRGIKTGNRELTYLSWSDAYECLCKFYPDNSYEFEVENYDNGTVMVHCTLTIREGEHELTKKMWLPVMNNKNMSIVNPSSRDVSDTMMRCLAKTIAMFGLGLYVYKGQDLPTAEREAEREAERAAVEKISVDRVRQLLELLHEAEADIDAFCQAFGIKSVNDLTNQYYEKAISAINKKIAAKG